MAQVDMTKQYVYVYGYMYEYIPRMAAQITTCVASWVGGTGAVYFNIEGTSDMSVHATGSASMTIPAAPIPAGIELENAKRAHVKMPVPVLDDRGRPT